MRCRLFLSAGVLVLSTLLAVRAEAAPRSSKPAAAKAPKGKGKTAVARREEPAEEPPAPRRLLVDRRGDVTKDPASSEQEKSGKSSPARRYNALPNVEVRARDLRLTDEAKGRLVRIAERYARATGQRLVVTGGTRSARRQAQLMIEKLEHGDDMVGLYEQKDAAREVEAAYQEVQRGARRRRHGALERAQQVIEAQMQRGVYVSQHLLSGAVDVRSRGMSEALREALKQAVSAEPGAALLDERDGAEPHFHLALSGP
ncbi:MAG: hypothetical protein MUF64_27235 [Polyangiaceae bacterium]|jgi:hypothetical protein|nr:hypothetical protein [Polyangiaceae bacterium]